MLFLSYAKPDSENARKIYEWFRGQDIEVYRWENPERRGGLFIPQIEREIYRAHTFVALMSPDYMESKYCYREAILAIQREIGMQKTDAAADYIRVLMVKNTPHLSAGFLSSYDWLDVTSEEKIQRVLPTIASRVSGKVEESPAAPLQAGLTSPMFRNREDEIERVLRGLTNAAGSHFWLVIAAPQLGKTWFLDHLAAKLLGEKATWTVTRVDVREYPAELRGDVATLLMDLFGLRRRPADTGPNVMRTIAQSVLARGEPNLCLLDSAELLSANTADALRSCLGEIYRMVQRGGIDGVRLGLVVASRSEDGWRGVTPDPRLTPLPLTQFKPDVVRGALRDLAQDMHRFFSAEELDRITALVYRLTEGLPALLVLCLRWIQKEEWLELERLESQEIFDALTKNYIQLELLSNDSLLPCQRMDDDEAPRRAVEYAFLALAPYRLFTQSHLRHHLKLDDVFERTLGGAEWSAEELWERISNTALLSRPLAEPWQETQAAIRRLLFRYFNRTDERRIEAHQKARLFSEVWWDGQTGTEQVIGLVECLWHEAVMLSLRRAADMEETLCSSARAFAESIKKSLLYTEAELRRSAARRIRNDAEFQATVSGIPGLFMKLARIVESTEGP